MNDKTWQQPSSSSYNIVKNSWPGESSNNKNWLQSSTTQEGWGRVPNEGPPPSNNDNWSKSSTAQEGWGSRVPNEGPRPSNDDNWSKSSTAQEGWSRVPNEGPRPSNDDNWLQSSTTQEGWGPRVSKESDWPEPSTGWDTQGVQPQVRDDWVKKQDPISNDDMLVSNQMVESELEENLEQKQAIVENNDDVMERRQTPPQDQEDNRVIKQSSLSDDDEWVTSGPPISSQDRENDHIIKQIPTPEDEWVTSQPFHKDDNMIKQVPPQEEVEWITSNPPASVHDHEDQWKKQPFLFENTSWNRKRSSPSEDNNRSHKKYDKDPWGGKGRSEGSWEKKNDANDGSLKYNTTRARSVDQHSKNYNSIDPMEMEPDDLSTLAMQEVIHNSFTTLKHNERKQFEEYDLNDHSNSVPPEILQETDQTLIQDLILESHNKNDHLEQVESSFTTNYQEWSGKAFRDVEVQTDPIDLTSLEDYLNSIDPSIMNILRKKLTSILGIGLAGDVINKMPIQPDSFPAKITVSVKPSNENNEPQWNISLNEASSKFEQTKTYKPETSSSTTFKSQQDKDSFPAKTTVSVKPSNENDKFEQTKTYKPETSSSTIFSKSQQDKDSFPAKTTVSVKPSNKNDKFEQTKTYKPETSSSTTFSKSQQDKDSFPAKTTVSVKPSNENDESLWSHPITSVRRDSSYDNFTDNTRRGGSRPSPFSNPMPPKLSLEEAWNRLLQADSGKDIEGFKEAFEEYAKTSPKETFQSIEKKLRIAGCNGRIIALKREGIPLTQCLIDLQGNTNKKYLAQLITSPDRLSRASGKASSEDENFQWLADAGFLTHDPTPVCFNCKHKGHNTKDCPEPKHENERNIPLACQHCGATDHITKLCKSDERRDHYAEIRDRNLGGDDGGYKYGSSNNMVRDYNSDSVGLESNDDRQSLRRSQTCHNCNREGHISRDCPESKKDDRRCFKCGKTGHFERDCNIADNPSSWNNSSSIQSVQSNSQDYNFRNNSTTNNMQSKSNATRGSQERATNDARPKWDAQEKGSTFSSSK
ncbi:18691_t:CDS:2, partial [Dentiscutata erythropus]